MLICHGDAEDLSMRPDLGHNDPPLTTIGLRQAALLAEHLRVEGLRRRFAAVYTSPLQPAAVTASVIADAIGQPLQTVLNELSTLTPEWLPATTSSAFEEVMTTLQERAWSGIEQLQQAHAEDEAIIAVTHRLTIQAVVCKVLALPLAQFGSFKVQPASRTSLDFRRQRVLLAGLNDLCHLTN